MKYTFPILCALVFSAAIAPNSAYAYAATSAYACMPDLNDYPGDFKTLEGMENRAGGWRWRELVCPVENFGVAISGMRITGYDGNNNAATVDNFLANGCSSRWTDGSYHCSGWYFLPFPTSTFTGRFFADLPWEIISGLNTHQHRHLHVIVPTGGALGYSRLVGFETW